MCTDIVLGSIIIRNQLITLIYWVHCHGVFLYCENPIASVASAFVSKSCLFPEGCICLPHLLHFGRICVHMFGSNVAVLYLYIGIFELCIVKLCCTQGVMFCCLPEYVDINWLIWSSCLLFWRPSIDYIVCTNLCQFYKAVYKTCRSCMQMA